MKIAYLDCFSGISGDMVLGALVDAGCQIAQIESHLRQLPIGDWKIAAREVKRCGLRAVHVTVESGEEHCHRSLSDIRQLLLAGALPEAVTEKALMSFQRLAEAEARVHGISVDQVHFHEVGAVDAIIDIAGASAGFDLLGVQEIRCSPLNVGGGRVRTAHGVLPVPAPATAELLRGAPIYSNRIDRELVTPTGAALATTLSAGFGPMPAMTAEKVGCGAGTADPPEQPNILRLFLGEACEKHAGPEQESLVVLEANLDDMNPQIYGHFVEVALAVGALDVFSTPAQMKKNRPGQLLTVLCHPVHEQELTNLIFRETTTLGVRRSAATRRTLERDMVTVQTALGPIRMKVARLDGRTINAAPEYDDCHRVAAEQGIPLKRVLAEASFEYRKQFGVAI